MAVYKRDIVDINLETGNIHRSFLKHSIGYKDQKADHFGIRTYRNGEPVDLTGVSVQGIFLPPQGDPIAITSGNIVDGNVAEVVLPQACYNYDGQFTLAIKLVDSSNSVTGTMRIVDGMVDNTHASGTVAPTDAVPTYQEILATYDAMVTATTAATTAATNVGSIVAAAYSTSATYAVGDYCTKDGNLYRCTTAITTAESWTAAHWTQTKMGPDVSDLKSALDYNSNVIKTTDYIERYGVVVGGLINDGTVDSTKTTRRTTGDYIPVSPGEVLRFTNLITSSTIWIGTYNSSKTSLGVTTVTKSSPYDYTVGSGVAYVKFTVGADVVANGLSIRPKTNHIEEIDNTLAEHGTEIANMETKHDSDIAEIANAVSSTNVFNGVFQTGKYIDVDGTIGDNTNYAYTHSYIPVEEGDVLSAGALECLPALLRYVCAYDSSKNAISAKGTSTASLTYTVPSGVAYVRITVDKAFSLRSNFRINKCDRLLPYMAYSENPKLIVKKFEYVDSHNKIDPTAIQSGKFMRQDGTVSSDSKYSYTGAYIPVHKDDVVKIVKNGVCDTEQFRFVAAFDDTLTAVSASGSALVNSYTVPDGVYYIICTFSKPSYESGDLAININGVYPYDDFYTNLLTENELPDIRDDVALLKQKIGDSDPEGIVSQPLTTLPSYIAGNLAYKPLGHLTKPYLCLITDDGRIEMNTYTIPMILSKGVPCTFAIMKGSEVMADASKIAVVKNAIANGCAVAQHGGVNWTQYTEKELNDFFDDEAAFFAEKEIEVKGAVIPSGLESEMINAMIGGRYGVGRTTFGGHNVNPIYYGDYLAGARSNLYCLPAFNHIYYMSDPPGSGNYDYDTGVARNKAIIDYAIEHNLLAILYTHDKDLVETPGYGQALEAIIDYAKTQNITFITFGDILTGKVI